MGLFSKLFAKKAAQDAAADMYGEERHYFDNLEPSERPVNVEGRVDKKNPIPMTDAMGKELPWGEVMPHEYNQYSSGLSYQAYFTKIFNEDFPDYVITSEPTPYLHEGVRFTFTRNGQLRLIVEVLSDKQSSWNFAQKCYKEGTPYMNFYHDHKGWWNVRSYVTKRVRSKL